MTTDEAIRVVRCVCAGRSECRTCPLTLVFPCLMSLRPGVEISIKPSDPAWIAPADLSTCMAMLGFVGFAAHPEEARRP